MRENEATTNTVARVMGQQTMDFLNGQMETLIT